MIYYHISGGGKSFSLFLRDTEAKFPFISSLYNSGGTSNNVRSWKTEAGIKRFVAKNCPHWVYESTEEYRARKLESKSK